MNSVAVCGRILELTSIQFGSSPQEVDLEWQEEESNSSQINEIPLDKATT